jgi:hypothetical protein
MPINARWFIKRIANLFDIATAKTVRTFLIPETLDSTPFLPDALAISDWHNNWSKIAQQVRQVLLA